MSERKWITHYFEQGYEYDEVIEFLEKYQNHKISRSTLLRRLKSYNLKRRHDGYISPQKIQEARVEITKNKDGPGSAMGYRAVWHSLRLNGIQLPRNLVQVLLKQIDPAGSDARKSRRLKRRTYQNPGPDHSWHMDGHDKIKPFGFAIHGAIDGYSRKVIWLKVLRSNNCPNVIGKLYLKALREFGGCPRLLVSDLGTENGIAAASQAHFWDDIDAHRYVPSPRNQRIEAWWSFYVKSRGSWWRNFFLELENDGTLDLSVELQKECLWYCFSEVIQNDINFVKVHWNSHRIRNSRFETIPGRPNVLYFLPERSGGKENLKLEVEQHEIDEIEESLPAEPHKNEHQEYFKYVQEELGEEDPKSYDECLSLYKKLKDISINGI